MSQPYYVTLTGSRNNAGDYLIRHRAHHLLAELRPDRTIVDHNSWEPFTDERIEEINGANALILLGGPALRRNMYPEVYPMTPDLDRIKVPISIMGAGWHAVPGTWEDSRDYQFTPTTLALLQRVERGGAGLSVRDYRSLNALQNAGINGGVMTGCPALYVPKMIGRPMGELAADGPMDIVFSLGVNFIRSAALERQTKQLILGLRDGYPRARLTVAFHHSIDLEGLASAYGAGQELSAGKHREIATWLDGETIAYQDISGGVDKLLELYGQADFHVGYRVHAHIFMSSLRKPSVLLTEDGRGRGLKDVIGGVIFDTWKRRGTTTKERVLKKLGRPTAETLVAFSGIEADVRRIYQYEAEMRSPRFSQPVGRIDAHYQYMRRYLAGLP